MTSYIEYADESLKLGDETLEAVAYSSAIHTILKMLPLT